jgi:hypothetical protein
MMREEGAGLEVVSKDAGIGLKDERAGRTKESLHSTRHTRINTQDFHRTNIRIDTGKL